MATFLPLLPISLMFISILLTITIPILYPVALVPPLATALRLACPQAFTLAEAALVTTASLATLLNAMDAYMAIPGQWDDVHSATAVTIAGVATLVAVVLIPAVRIRRQCWMIVSGGVMVVGGTYVMAGRMLHVEPVGWVVDMVRRRGMSAVVVWWFGCVVAAAAVCVPEKGGGGRAVARKYYHVVALAIFGIGVQRDVAVTGLAAGGGLGLLVGGEIGRTGVAGETVRRKVDAVAKRLVDERDGGALVVTHVYLLMGCAVGMWVWAREDVAKAGVVGVCVLDSVAAAVGKRCGRTEWVRGGGRTVEGSIGGMVAATVALRVWGGMSWAVAVVASMAGGAVEATTDQIDNLVVPMTMCAAVAAMNEAWRVRG